MESNNLQNPLPNEYANLKRRVLLLIRELEKKENQEKKNIQTLLFLQKQNTELHQEIINRDKQISMLLNR